MTDVLVKHAYGAVYDAFWGNGWKSWTRFLFRNGQVTYIKGKAIDGVEKEALTILVKDGHAAP